MPDIGGICSLTVLAGKETVECTYTVRIEAMPESIDISPSETCTYSSEEEAVYTIKGTEEFGRPGYFLINGERVEGNIIDRYTLTYTFPKGSTGIYTLCGMPEKFLDVNKEDWFYEEVTDVEQKKLMTGLNSTYFGAADTLVRAQFALILHRIEDEPQVKHAITFEDVDNNSWYTGAIRWADCSKIMTGYEDNGLFGTNDPITREQMATVMYRYAKEYKKYDVSKKADFSKFEDASSVTAFAKDAMEWAVGNGIITGKDGGTKLDPQGYANRAECAAIIQRFVEKYE